MLDTVVIEAGPSRFARACVVLLVAALAYEPSTSVLTQRACSMSPGGGHEPATMRRRTAGLQPRYLQRELPHGALHAR